MLACDQIEVHLSNDIVGNSYVPQVRGKTLTLADRLTT